MVLAGAPGPSALIMKSTPSPPVRDFAHAAVEASPSACTSMRSGASAFTRSSSARLRPVPRMRVIPMASPRSAAPSPSVPQMPSTSIDCPATALAFFMAP